MGPLLRGRYEVLKKLGEGAFGETYKAKDHERPSKPFCLVKRLKPVHTNQIVRDFFDREAAVLERLGEHPQIPRLLAHFTVGQELFIVQEFIEGHSLRREIILGRQLNETSVMHGVQDVLEILTFVHQNGVVHRDIKPENLMRRHDGKLILIDFGAVKELGSVIVTPSGEIQTLAIGWQKCWKQWCKSFIPNAIRLRSKLCKPYSLLQILNSLLDRSPGRVVG
jgi:serine/threonine protein kinase